MSTSLRPILDAEATQHDAPSSAPAKCVRSTTKGHLVAFGLTAYMPKTADQEPMAVFTKDESLARARRRSTRWSRGSMWYDDLEQRAGFGQGVVCGPGRNTGGARRM